MKLNSQGLNEEQKQLRLKKLSTKSDKNKKHKVFFPARLQQETGSFLLSGYYHQNTLTFNIIDYIGIDGNADSSAYPFFSELGARTIGIHIGKDDLHKVIEINANGDIDLDRQKISAFLSGISFPFLPDLKINILFAYSKNDELVFQVLQEEIVSDCQGEMYSLKLDVFSRNTGILETDMMSSMTAVVSGCGSVGSYVALELARSGVGRFLLIDNDTVSYANVCRHQCGIADVGRYKAEAVADRIRLINPAAQIGIQNTVVENVPPAVFNEFCGPDSIIIGCADNRQGDLFTCKVAAHYRMPMVSIGFWERAFAGEVFYWIPERSELSCYQCFVNALGDISGRQSVNRRFYTTETDLSKVNFMPGISVDITFVTNVGVKLILDIFNRNNAGFIPRLLDSLTQFTLIANTNKPEIGGEQASIFSYPLQVTTSIEVMKSENCKYCNQEKG